MITFILPIGSEFDVKLTFELLIPSFFYFKEDFKFKFIIIYKSDLIDIIDKYLDKFDLEILNL